MTKEREAREKTADVCIRNVIGQRTFHKSKNSSMEASEVRRRLI